MNSRARKNSTGSTSATPTEQVAATSESESYQTTIDSTLPLNMNDALSYLSDVKEQFKHDPHVYNQFLEIMKDFESHTINTEEVIQRVLRLFRGYPSLIERFNTFLPTGYHINVHDDPNVDVTVTTPSGMM